MKVGEDPKKTAGIYVHIPFCHKACSYCDFYFSVQKKYIPTFIDAILKEIELRKDFFQNQEIIQTLYLGGGTPSILHLSHLNKIYSRILNNFKNLKLQEVTIEANPEDITLEKLHFWQAIGINRISLGVQSIHEEELQFMKRNHTNNQTLQALELINKSDINNFNIDIIYGLPNSSISKLEKTLQTLITFNPTHFSCYALTIEPNTLLNHQYQKKQFHIIEEHYLQQYDFIVKYLDSYGYHRYELSNFAKTGYISLHNSSYWKHNPYLGLGPSAHSLYDKQRSANIANLHQYSEKLHSNELPIAFYEKLNSEQIHIEEIMFAIRQNLGIKVHDLPENLLLDWYKKEYIYLENNKIFFTNKGLMLSDSLILYLI